MSSVPSGHPLRFFFRSASFFMWEVINLADLPGWGKKVTACSRWLFFGSGELGDELRFEIQIDQISIFVYLHRFFQGVEVLYRLPADLGDLFQVDGVGSGSSGFEGDGEEGYFFFVVYEVGGEHDVGEVVVFRESADVFVYQVCAHQAEGGVGIRDFYVEDHAKEEAYRIFYELSGFSVTTDFTVSDDGIERVSFFPELFKFCRVGLSVRVSLENVICVIFDGITVAVKHCGTVSTVGFIQGDKQWMIFHLGFDKLQSIIFTAVVNDYQAGFAFFVVTFYDRVPVPDGLFYIFRLIICRNYDK